MSICLYPEFESELDAKAESTGELLFYCVEELDALAEENGLTPLGQFGDCREIPEDFDGDPDELDEVMGPWEEWFDAAEGAAAFDAIIDCLNDHPSETRFHGRQQYVIEELRDAARLVHIAAEQNVRFRLNLLI